MPEYKVKLIRAACKEIQKLSQQDFEDVAKIIKSFCSGNLGDCRKLEGYQDLWRTRTKDIRVIWTKVESNTILVIKAGQRKDIYQGLSEDRNRSNPLELSSVLDIEADKVCNIPSYEWSNRNNTSWHQFIYGGYVYSPVLTEEQRQIFVKLQETSTRPTNRENTIPNFLLQSSPGTGKTICAALLACEFYQIHNWNVVLILPETLCEEVKEFSFIKQINQESDRDGFFVGNFEELMQIVFFFN